MIFSFLQFPMRTFERLCSVLRMRKLLVPMATPLFFKQAWSVVGRDFCAAVQDFFISARLLKQINHLVIAFVPKSANVSSISDFEPISCCNVIYKVIAKILAGCLARVLSGIISPMHHAFLGGRLMSDNINLVQELLRQYNRKRSSPRCQRKIDFRKAFDSVQWNFIGDLLRQFGFLKRFVHLIMQCVSTTSFSIVVNGDLYGFFPGKSGVRQRDHLSPYLFICCMEYFSRMLILACRQPGFRFHPKCGIHDISHLAFTDDVLLLSCRDCSSVNGIFQQLTNFGKTAGLDINLSKSLIWRC